VQSSLNIFICVTHELPESQTARAQPQQQSRSGLASQDESSRRFCALHTRACLATTRTYSRGTAGLAIDFLAAFTHIHRLIACLAARCQTLAAHKSRATTEAMEVLTSVTEKRIHVAFLAGRLFTNFTHDQRPAVKAVETSAGLTEIDEFTFTACGTAAFVANVDTPDASLVTIITES